jgi:putative ABC transport system permease protein
MDSILRDIRYAFRTLIKNPAFTAIAVVTIGLGIGANTAIFSVVQAVLLKPLPYEEPQELLIVWSEMTARDVEYFPISPPVWKDIRENSEIFEDVAGMNAFQQPLNIEGQALQLSVGNVTPNFFRVLGVDLLMGRDFAEEDAVPVTAADGTALQPGANAPTVTILSHAFWQTGFGGDPSVLGRSVDLGGTMVEIIGVLPEDFEPLLPAQANVAPGVALYVTPRFDIANWNPANVFFPLIGRLSEGRTLAQAQTELDRFSASWADQVPVFAAAGNRYWARPLHEDLTASIRPVVLALLGAVGFVLLIACANVSNLLLVRASTRGREMAVRAALGGSRQQLVRQMLIESGVLAGLGALLGLGLAQFGIEALLALQPDNLPRLDTVRIDGAVLGFTALASVVAAVLFGLIPAVQGSRMELSDALRGRNPVGATRNTRFIRSTVIITEVALSVVLLVGAGLMIRSFAALQSVDAGFDSEEVLTFQAPLPGLRYPNAEDRALTMERMRVAFAGLPGVEGVSSIFPPLLSGPNINGRYGPEEALEDEAAFGQAAYKVVQPDFFETIGASLVEGRFLNAADQSDSASVVVVDETLASKLWPGESAVGQQVLIRYFTPEPIFVNVVGVVRNLRHETLATESRETIFFPDRYVGSFANTTWVVKASNPTALVESIRRELATIDPTVPLAEVKLLDEFVAEDMGPTRFLLTLIGVFGATALILASVGLYGVLSNVVRQRQAEIGVRMAFGAETGSILTLIARQGMTLAGIGLGIGLVAAFGVTGLMESLLVGVQASDPVTFAATAAVFLLVAAGSCLIPARRAAKLDPVVALRED